MDKASVSVVIPCYQCVDTIKRTVDSVANQTLRPFELILVDDGSKDETPEIIKEIQSFYGDDWVKIILLSQNGGVSVARNTGWDIATADYIAFLDSDDLWHPEKITIQYSWMLGNPHVDISGHASLIVAPNSQVNLQKTDVSFTVNYISPAKLILSNPFVTPSFMIKRCLGYRFDPLRRYAEDFYLLQQAGMDGHVIAMLDVVLVYVFKTLGVSGASSNLYKMRLGDVKNYWSLWCSKRINVAVMSILIMFSVSKFILLLILGGRAHGFFNTLLSKLLRIRR